MESDASNAAGPVQKQIEACNARDLDALMECWAEDGATYDFPSTVIARGAAAIRAQFQPLFEEPDLAVRLVKRIVLGDLIVDAWTLARTLPEGPGETDVVAIFQLVQGKIAKAWFKSGPNRLRATTPRPIEAAAGERPVYTYGGRAIMLQTLGIGAALLTVAIPLFLLGGTLAMVAFWLLLAASLLPLGIGASMIAYACAGQSRLRDHMLDAVPWSGAERVLDVGTGTGLMLVGAAKRLRTGRAVGIDAWWRKDPTGRRRGVIERNVRLEGVADRVELRTADVRALPMPDGSFDRVIALLCLHEHEVQRQQAAACREIARVLKPGGVALIGDYVPTTSYAVALAEAGLVVQFSRSALKTALTPIWVLAAAKPPAPNAGNAPGTPASAAPPDPALAD